MVFYLCVEGASSRPTATVSSGVFEKVHGAGAAEPAGADSAAVPPPPADAGAPAGPGARAVVDVCRTAAVRLFRASGSGSSRSLLEDALPIQRTSALLLVAVPSEVSHEELEAFLGDPLADVEALRVLRRDGAAAVSGCTSGSSGSGAPTAAAAAGASGSFYSVVVLCRTQAGADALYRANHGRLFPAATPPAPPAASAKRRWSEMSESDDDERGTDEPRDLAGGPCCYLVFLEAITYVLASAGEQAAEVGARPAPGVPTAASELPACPLCLERLDVSATGMVTHQQGWLSGTEWAKLVADPAGIGCCRACSRIARTHLAAGEGKGPSCEACGKEKGIWVCVVCGHLGCGRYDLGHAKDHATDLQHRFCLELTTGRIWDYSGDVFVHRRLVQMAAASGGFFDVTLSAPAAARDAHQSPQQGLKQSRGGQSDVLAMELDAILTSQLDHQRSLYEVGLVELTEEHSEALQREHAKIQEEQALHGRLDARAAEAEGCRRGLEKQLAAAQKSRAEVEERLAFLKELNQSLLANRRDIDAGAAGGSQGSAEGAVAAKSDPLVCRLRKRVEELREAVSAP